MRWAQVQADSMYILLCAAVSARESVSHLQFTQEWECALSNGVTEE